VPDAPEKRAPGNLLFGAAQAVQLLRIHAGEVACRSDHRRDGEAIGC